MNIKLLRNKIGLSQQGLADATGIPKGRIGQWEIGNGQPKKVDSDILINFFIKHGVQIDKIGSYELDEHAMEEYDVAAAVKKMEAMNEVILSAVGELLAKANNQSSTVVKEQLQDLVNKRLKP